MLKGTVEHLQIGLGRANLLSGLSGSKAENIIALADAVGGFIGGEAVAAAFSNHEIGELEYFACYIDEDLVQGVYPNVTFQDGDEVEVVIRRSGSRNYVQAVRRKKDDMMWIPLMMEKSIGATFLRTIKEMRWFMLLGYIAWGAFTLLDVWSGLDLKGQLFIWSIPAVGSFIMAIWDFAASYSTGMQSTKIFRFLGLPNAYWIDLSPYSLMNLDNDPYGECVYRYPITAQQ